MEQVVVTNPLDASPDAGMQDATGVACVVVAVQLTDKKLGLVLDCGVQVAGSTIATLVVAENVVVVQPLPKLAGTVAPGAATGAGCELSGVQEVVKPPVVVPATQVCAGPVVPGTDEQLVVTQRLPELAAKVLAAGQVAAVDAKNVTVGHVVVVNRFPGLALAGVHEPLGISEVCTAGVQVVLFQFGAVAVTGTHAPAMPKLVVTSGLQVVSVKLFNALAATGVHVCTAWFNAKVLVTQPGATVAAQVGLTPVLELGHDNTKVVVL